MTEKFHDKYRIPSARATWHDYNGGAYFVTICTKNREHYFGRIIGNENDEPQMALSEIGKCTVECLHNVNDHFPHVDVPLFVVMPNHIHAIIIIDPNVGTQNVGTQIVETQNFASLRDNGNKFGPQSKNLASVVRGFKIGVTKFARQNNIDFAWQTRFHDHIIRNQNELNNFADYIENNIAKWQYDELNDGL